MAEEPKPPKPGPSKRVIIGWTAFMLGVLGLAWFTGAIGVPYYRSTTAIDDWRERRIAAEEAIGRLGGPQEAVPRIEAYLREPRLSRPGVHDAILLLAECGRPAVPVLTALIEKQDMDTRMAVMAALAEIGPEADDAVPALIRFLGHRDGAVCELSVEALRRIGPKAIPEVAKALNGSSTERIYAAWCLSEMGPASVPELVKALESKDADLRNLAAMMLGRMGRQAAGALPVLAKLRDNDAEETVRQAAREAISSIKPGGAAGARLTAAWKALLGNNPKSALAALSKLDSMIKKGMSEAEVRQLFPPGALVVAPTRAGGKARGWYLKLNARLEQRVLAPNAWGLYDYGIKLDENHRVVRHQLILGGDE